MLCDAPSWARQMVLADDADESLPLDVLGINVVLNRARLAVFLAAFSTDRDVQDLLALDILVRGAGLPITSTGLTAGGDALPVRMFRVWEYAWLYKSLGLSRGRARVLDLGGPASHLCFLAALAGCEVTSLDVNPDIVTAATDCAAAMGLATLDARLGDMRDLSMFADGGFDVVISCSVLEHLRADDQRTAMREVARVLRPGGLVGLTFDFGEPAPAGDAHLPPPHDPPRSADAALDRFVQGGLVAAGNAFIEEPIPGSLFRDPSIQYTIASLFLAKPPAPEIAIPVCEEGGSRLAGFPIHQLARRSYEQTSSGAMLLDALQAEREQWRRRAAQAAFEVNHSLEQAAAARLAALLEKEAEIQRLSAELQVRQAAMEDLHAQLERAIAAAAHPQEVNGAAPPASTQRWFADFRAKLDKRQGA